jgi:hypothetical protein
MDDLLECIDKLMYVLIHINRQLIETNINLESYNQDIKKYIDDEISQLETRILSKIKLENVKYESRSRTNSENDQKLLDIKKSYNINSHISKLRFEINEIKEMIRSKNKS